MSAFVGDTSATPAAGTVDAAFWRGRRVLVTGHTGFKGAWLALWLQNMGAEVTGFARGVPTEPSLYALAGVAGGLAGDVVGDVRDAEAVRAAVVASGASVVIHMAAQPMVRRSFVEPRETYETNVMGTVNVLDAVRVAGAGSVRAVVNVTSDKCYDNFDGREPRPFVEDDPKGGHDPYSNSKGCAELVADAYRRSFFSGGDGGSVGAGGVAGVRLASVRAGNVIGGGDWGEDRLVPDIMRGAAAGAVIPIRRPDAVRPWQHVLNPLSGYLVVAQALASDDASVREAAAGGWNFGPADDDVRPVEWIVARLTELWPADPLRWEIDAGPHPHEAGFLSLDSGKARAELGWAPRWDLETTLASIVEWHAGVSGGVDARALTLGQIERFAGAATP